MLEKRFFSHPMGRRGKQTTFGVFLLTFLVVAGLSNSSANGETEPKSMEPFIDRVPESNYDFEMIPIPKGTIEVEDPEKPGSKKTIEVGPFWIGKSEVTWDMFDPWVNLEERAFIQDLPPDPDGITGDRKSVV